MAFKIERNSEQDWDIEIDGVVHRGVAPTYATMKLIHGGKLADDDLFKSVWPSIDLDNLPVDYFILIMQRFKDLMDVEARVQSKKK